jgi:hypothetical protein
VKIEATFFSASVLHPFDSTDCLHPAEPLLDALSDALTEFATRMTGCATIYCGSASCVLRDVRRHVDLAQFHDEVGRIETLIGCQRDRARREPRS